MKAKDTLKEENDGLIEHLKELSGEMWNVGKVSRVGESQ